jgi:hypothetical protein
VEFGFGDGWWSTVTIDLLVDWSDQPRTGPQRSLPWPQWNAPVISRECSFEAAPSQRRCQNDRRQVSSRYQSLPVDARRGSCFGNLRVRSAAWTKYPDRRWRQTSVAKLRTATESYDEGLNAQLRSRSLRRGNWRRLRSFGSDASIAMKFLPCRPRQLVWLSPRRTILLGMNCSLWGRSNNCARI